MRGAARMHIRGARRDPKARDRRSAQPFVMRQSFLPVAPKAVFPNSQLAILLQASAALTLDRAFPLRPQIRGFADSLLLDNPAQHVQIVDLAQNVLEVLQIGAPHLILLWQQTFDRVAEFFQADSESVPGGG